jgi:hypothetical protein
MSTEATGNPFEGEETGITLKVVTDQIQKVIRSPPIKKGDTSTYHIFLDGREITMTAAQLHQGPGRFSTLYFDAFQKFLFAKKDDWPKFAEFIAGIAEEGELEETAAVMAADIIFEEICSTFDITEDKEMLTDREQCRAMVLHQPHDKMYLVVPAGAMSGLIGECGIKSTSSDIADAMRARGYLNGNTRAVKVTGVNVRCWWLLPKAVKAQGVDLSNLGVEL